MALTGGWHPYPEQLADYLGGRSQMLGAASMEAHLLRCAQCRAELARLTAPQPDRTWQRICDAVVTPELPRLVRVLRRLGVSDPDAVVLAVAQSMSTAWLVSVLLVLAFIAAAALVTGGGASTTTFLVLAPLVPVGGVSVAFGMVGQRLADVVDVTPYPVARLVLLRSGLVLLTSVVPAVLLGLALPGPRWVAATWLLPALAFTVAVLAAATWVEPVTAAGVIAIGWTSVVLAAARRAVPWAPFDAYAQLAYLLLLVLAAAVLIERMRTFHNPGGIR